jgi:predicted O-methyltransferase YrrM
MISDQRKITVNDLGQGSERQKSNTRKVSDIAKNTPVPQKYGFLLSNLAKEFGDKQIIELGTSLGISTMYLATGSPHSKIATIDGCSSIAEIAEENFKEAGIRNIQLYDGSFDSLLPVLVNEDNTPGMVFIDGDHRKEAVLKYFSYISKYSSGKTVVVIDDINYSEGMAEAWNEVKRWENVSVTIDLYRFGLVFFREAIARNNYIIRY